MKPKVLLTSAKFSASTAIVVCLAAVRTLPAQSQSPNGTRGISAPLESQTNRVAVGQASGRAVRQLLQQVIASPAYQQAPPEGRKFLLERAIAEARATVTGQVRRELMESMRGGVRP